MTTKAILSVYFVSILSKVYNNNGNNEDFDKNENFEYLNNYLKNLLIYFSINKINIQNLNVIYDQLK
jgi:hypothetical protein